MEGQREFFRPGEFADHPPAFEEFWKAYPKRRGKRLGKQAARRLWLKLKAKEQCEAHWAARNYAQSSYAREGYARDANRFLTAEYWRGWLDGAGDPADEREALVEALKKYAGKPYKSSYVTTKGTDSLHSSRPWNDFSLQELREMKEWLNPSK